MASPGSFHKLTRKCWHRGITLPTPRVRGSSRSLGGHPCMFLPEGDSWDPLCRKQGYHHCPVSAQKELDACSEPHGLQMGWAKIILKCAFSYSPLLSVVDICNYEGSLSKGICGGFVFCLSKLSLGTCDNGLSGLIPILKMLYSLSRFMSSILMKSFPLEHKFQNISFFLWLSDFLLPSR